MSTSVPSPAATSVPTSTAGPPVTGRAEPASPAREPRRWWLLAALAVAQLMISLDTTVITIALPSAQADLQFSDSARPWVITGYALAFGSLLLLSGRLSDRWGRRRLLLVGLVGFTLVSALGGAAPTVEVLVAARIGQGVFAALLAPAALAMVSTTFSDGAERARAFGVFGSVAMVGTVVGLLLGGALTEALSWRWTMFINIAFAVPAVVGVLAVGTVSAAAQQRTKAPLDAAGAVTVTFGLFALVLGTSTAETSGWSAPATVGLLAASGVLLVVFAWLQARVAHPLLPLRILADRGRGGALIALLLSSAGLFTTFLFLPFYLQSTLGFPQTLTGLSFLPVPVALAVAATVVGPALTRRLGVRGTVPLGLVLAAAGALLLTGIGLDTGYASHVLPSLVLVGAGVGLVIATATGAATARLGDELAGAAAAAVNAAQQVGGSVGVALLSTVAAAAAASSAATHPDAPAGTAAVESYTTAFGWIGVVFLAGAVLAAVVVPSKERAA